MEWKTLIVVYKDELLVNQLKKLVEEGEMPIGIISWREKEWLKKKKEGDIQEKILFLGGIKGIENLVPIVDVKFSCYGIGFGCSGNQSVLTANPDVLKKRKNYDAFLTDLYRFPIPDFMRNSQKNNVIENAVNSKNSRGNSSIDEGESKNLFLTIKNFANEKIEELNRDRSLVEQEMLIYGIFKLYNEELKKFLNLGGD